MPTASLQMMTQLHGDFKSVHDRILKVEAHIKNFKENSDDKEEPPSAKELKKQKEEYKLLLDQMTSCFGSDLKTVSPPKRILDEADYKKSRPKVTNIMKYLEMTEKMVEKEKLVLAEQIKKQKEGTDLDYLKKNCPDFVTGGGTVIKDKKDSSYWGGTADDSHVHTYGGGFHVKLGSTRWNIVKDGTLYREAVKTAYNAMKSESSKPHVPPLFVAVRAALKHYKIT